jgi:hypothetical protein
MTTLRERLAQPVLVLLASLGAFGAGLSFMTHMHHRGLEHIDPDRMTDYDAGYEALSDLTVIPTGVVGVACVVALLWLRPRGVPLWMLATSLVLQLFVFVSRISMWGAWAEDVREHGSVRLPNGSFHDSYTQYMDTNWIRIAVISAYAFLALTMVVLSVSRGSGPSDRPGSPRTPAAARPVCS